MDLAHPARDRKCDKCVFRGDLAVIIEPSGGELSFGNSNFGGVVFPDRFDKSSLSKTNISDYISKRIEAVYFVCPVLRFHLGSSWSHKDEVLLCDTELLCDPSFQLGKTASDIQTTGNTS